MFSSKIFICLALVCSASAQISLQFASFSSALTSLSGPDGTVGENGLVWGIIIDTEDNGFAPITVQLNQSFPLSDGLEITLGDFYYFGGLTTEIPSAFAESGPGGVSSSGSMPVYSNPAVAAGQAFAIVWFESDVSNGSLLKAGSSYGVLTHPALLLPPNFSSNVPFFSFFAGVDPVRPASLFVQAQLPKIDCGIIANQFTVDFEVDTQTSEKVTFDLEELIIGEPNFWELQGVTPEVLESNGDVDLLRLTFPETVLEQSKVLSRVRVLSIPE